MSYSNFKSIFFLALPLALLLFEGCEPSGGAISEGTIEYKVTYPKMSNDNFMKDFMPDEMVMKFKDEKYLTELSAGMGMFKTNFLCDGEEEVLAQMVKLINKKYVLVMDKDEVGAFNHETPEYTITKTNEKKMIAGYECHKAVVSLNKGKQEHFDVYYTKEIDIELPNWCTKFKEIDGVLMEYQQERYDICMRFTATKVIPGDISESAFVIGEDYQEVSREKMDKEMTEIFESFNQ